MKPQLSFLAALLLAAAPLQAATLYNQATDLSGSAASQNDPGGVGEIAKTYDNFTLGAAATITGLDWTGSYFAGAGDTVTGFLVEIWADDTGSPGTSLYAETLAGTAGETALGTDGNGDPAYAYNATLATPFAAAAGTEYWLSIQAVLAGASQWGWENAIGGDGVAYQVFFGSPGSVGNDLAFSLDGTTGGSVPEPGSLVLLGAGLASWLGARRRASAVV